MASKHERRARHAGETQKQTPREALRKRLAAAALAGVTAVAGFAALAGTYYIDEGNIFISATDEGTSVLQGETFVEQDDDIVITQHEDVETTENRILISADEGETAEVTLKDVNIDTSESQGPAIIVVGEGDVTLELDGTNEVKSADHYAGLEKDDHYSEGTLTIDDADEDGGSLKATGGYGGAGIGGGGGSDGTVTINGGEITAIGGGYGAGIGGGEGGNGTVTINGGVIKAQGGEGGVGIGGGIEGNGTVTINGGVIEAQGGERGAGIGGGGGSDGTVTINGGEITAIGGGFGAGIGGGFEGSGTVTINGGTVNATGGEHAESIGSSFFGNREVTLNDGIITRQSYESNHVIHDWDGGRTEGCKTVYSCNCGATKTEFDHHMVEGAETTAPTCTKAGKQNTYCDNDGCNFEREITSAALGHSWDGGVVTTAPTCTAEGVRTYTCTRCGKTRTEAVAKLEPTAPTELHVVTPTGAEQVYERFVDGGRVLFAAPAQDAALTGSLSLLAELKAQGAKTLVFRTWYCETSVSIDKLLDAGGSEDTFCLTHTGAQANLTVAGRMVRV